MPFQTGCRKLAGISRRWTQVKHDRWWLPAYGKNTIIAGIAGGPKSLTLLVVVQFAAFSRIPSGARDPYSLRQSLEADRSVHLGMKSSVENLELVEENMDPSPASRDRDFTEKLQTRGARIRNL